MGHSELLTALRREGELKAVAIRRETVAGEARLRAAAAARMSERKGEEERQQARRRTDRQQEILAEAVRSARIIRLGAEHDLAVRLRALATALLSGLCATGYEQLFRGLTAELPAETWETVQVNPRDAALAGELFPAAAIGIDANIRGGLAVTATGGKFSAINTLEMRLERMWPDLLPDIVAELKRSLA
jgi:vacuolar-type H+-ATPase subunit E/Vma4